MSLRSLRAWELICFATHAAFSGYDRFERLAYPDSIVLTAPVTVIGFAGLAYYVGGEIAERKKLLVTTSEQLRTRFKLDVRTRTSVEAIDRSAKKVHVRDLASGREYEEAYDKLILAPGAAPLRPPISGIDLPGVFTLRNLQDVDGIKQIVDRGVKQAVVVGAGFIGLELVENFVKRGISTTVIELQDQVLPPFDKEMTTPILETLMANGVAVLLGQSADGLEQTADGLIQANLGIKALADAVLAAPDEHEDLRETVARLESLVIAQGQDLRAQAQEIRAMRERLDNGPAGSAS